MKIHLLGMHPENMLSEKEIRGNLRYALNKFDEGHSNQMGA